MEKTAAQGWIEGRLRPLLWVQSGGTGKTKELFLPGKVTDGVDQTALLLFGEGHSRRDYMFHYSGSQLGAVRWMDIKAILRGGGSHGGLPAIEMTNIKRDPGEKFYKMYLYLWTVAPFQNLVKSHMNLITKFPHRTSKVTPEGAELTSHD